MPAHICIPSEVCRDYSRSSQIEWIETDGTGGFAMGTAAGVNTRRYHGVLVMARRPPVDRFVLLSRLEETAYVGAAAIELATAQYPGTLHPQGFTRLESFRLAPFPVWTWAFDGMTIEKQVFLVRGASTAVIQFRSNRDCRLRIRPFIACRDFHALAHASPSFDGRVIEERVSPEGSRLRVTPRADEPSLYLHHNGVFTREGADWYYQTEYLVERDRGLDFREDLFCLGGVDFALSADTPAWIVASCQEGEAWNWPRVVSEEALERDRRRGPHSRTPEVGELASHLAAASDAFRVRRADGSPTFIAGYPWFADWGRDTMISLPGLLICRGLLVEAKEVIDGFLARMDRGLVPNRFADSGQPPEYNTVDGTLWMFHAVDAYLRAGGDRRWANDVFYPKGKESVAWHERGTHHGIAVDRADGLLVGGGPGSQLTWMDAKVAGRVVTPRHGKAVEVNALWFNALARENRDVEGIRHFASAAARVRESFCRKFWNDQRDCLFDVLLPEGPDGRLRPNQIFAVSLTHRMLTGDQERRVVGAVERHLLTPVGLRTLGPGEMGYCPHYGGDAVSRDSAYHQGTVWPWLLGPFATAYLNAFGRGPAQLAYVGSLIDGIQPHLKEGMMGQIGEVFDAEPPHRPGGAPAQAWSVAEILRVVATELRHVGPTAFR